MSAATLRKAAAIVRERGLAKGLYEDATGAVCAMGALRIAHVGSVEPCPPEGDYWSDRTRFREVVGCSPACFSDDRRTTAEDVAAAFEAAADRLDAATDTADAGPTPGAATN